MLSLIQKKLWILPLSLFGMNIILKLLYVTSNGIALDEPFSIFYSQLSPVKIINFLFSGDNPPLFELLLHYWTGLFGIESFSVRFLPLLFSSLTVIYVYLLGKKMSGTVAGLTAGLVYTFSSFHIYFAHEARVYSLFTLLSTASLYYYFSLEYKKHRAPFILFVLSNILLCYSHYFGLLVILGELCFSVFFLKNQPFSFRKVWLSFLIILAFLSPLFLVLPIRIGNAIHHGGTWVSKPPLDAWYENIRKFSNQPVIAVGFLCISILGIVYLFRRKLFKVNVIYLILSYWFFGLYTLLFLISFILPVFLDRYLIFLSIPFYLLVSAGAVVLIKGRFRHLLPLACCLGMLAGMNLNPGNERNPIGMSAYILENRKSATPVFITPPWLDKGVLYYCDRAAFIDPENFNKTLRSKSWLTGFSSGELIKLLPLGTKRILVVASGPELEEQLLREAGGHSFPFVKVESKQFGKSENVTLYEMKKEK